MTVRRTHTHPTPDKWAQYVNIMGVDRGHFPTINTRDNGTVVVTFTNTDNGDKYILTVKPGRLQGEYILPSFLK